MHWEVMELEKALEAGDIQLAKRYLSKIRQQLFCVKCKEEIPWRPQDSVPYFKGQIHRGCQA